MFNHRSHKTNTVIAVVMYVAFFAVLYFMTSSCTATKINRSTSKSDVTADTNITENENKKTNLFDRSKITEEDYSLRLVPIDPSKAMGQTTNPNTGEKEWRNAIPIYEKKTKTTNKNLATNSEEANSTKIDQTAKAAIDETNKEKTKFSLPWIAFVVLGLFMFLSITGIFFIYKLFKTIAPLVATVNDLNQRLKSLEQ